MSGTLRGRDLLTMADLSAEEVLLLLDAAAELKRRVQRNERELPLSGRSIAVILQKPSLRTRVSFEVAAHRLGAHPVVMSGPDGAFSRGESIHDTAKVLERYVDGIVIRTYAHSIVEELALHASVPVINALTDDHHPCQGLADLLTIREHKGRLAGLRFVYVGDGNNMAHTYLLAGALVGMDVVVATPPGFEPAPAVVEQARAIAEHSGSSVTLLADPAAAVTGADVVATDTWASMGQEAEHDARVRSFDGYQVDAALMARAAPDALFLHCLPAHRGEEVTDEVIDGRWSVVFDEAENRLHVQQALLLLTIG